MQIFTNVDKVSEVQYLEGYNENKSKMFKGDRLIKKFHDPLTPSRSAQE